MKKVLSKISVAVVGLLTPFFVFANSGVDTSGLFSLLNKIDGLVARIIPILIGLALLAFLWGIMRYLFSDKKDDAKTLMIWGIIALFVMTSVWGLVAILSDTILGTNRNTNLPPSVPSVPSAGYRAN